MKSLQLNTKQFLGEISLWLFLVKQRLYYYKKLKNINKKMIKILKSSFSTVNLPRLMVVMDIDGTMLYTKPIRNIKKEKIWKPLNERQHFVNGRFFGVSYDLCVELRPGLKEFIRKVGEFADFSLFTAGSKKYATIILRIIDPENKIFKQRFFNEHCGRVYSEKDLSLLEDYNEKRTVLVDDMNRSFKLQPRNGILIPDFYLS